MFKAGRYYFRKKTASTASTNTKEPSARCEYSRNKFIFFLIFS